MARGPVTFNANSSYDPDGDALDLTWDFGDGTDTVTTANRSIIHVFLQRGAYFVSLNVTDGHGAVNRTLPVIVEDPLPAVGGPRAGWLPTALLFMALVVVMVGAVYVAFALRRR